MHSTSAARIPEGVAQRTHDTVPSSVLGTGTPIIHSRVAQLREALLPLLKAQPLPRAYALQSGKSTKYHNRPYFGQVLIEEAALYLTTNRRVRISSRPSACRIRMY